MNEGAVQSSTSPASSSSMQARLATLFPTVGSNRVSRKDTSRRPAKSKRTIKSTKGRPSKALVYKDLVLIPSPKISKVPTHTILLELEERELVFHEFPFGKSWDPNRPRSIYQYSNIAPRLSAPCLRTFSRKFSNIDFFLKILPLKDDELVMSEM